MADARAKAVIDSLEPLYLRTRYLIDMVRAVGGNVGAGDTLEIPAIAALTVNSNGAVAANPAAVTTNVLSLLVNRHPWINSLIPKVDAIQLLSGNWPRDVARDSTMMLKNRMDEDLARDFLAREIAWDTAGTYHDNVAGDALAEDDILNAKANILSQDGVMEGNLALITSPFGEGSIMSISGFLPAGQVLEQGVLGIPRIGTVFGVPVFSTNSIARNITAAITASNVATNVVTLTLDITARPHGFVPGMLITTTGLSTNITTAVVIQTATTTQVTAALTAANGSVGTGTLVGRTSMNLLMDLSQVFAAQQMFPTTEVVKLIDTTGHALQVSSVWGRQARAGRVRVIHSPGSAVA